MIRSVVVLLLLVAGCAENDSRERYYYWVPANCKSSAGLLASQIPCNNGHYESFFIPHKE